MGSFLSLIPRSCQQRTRGRRRGQVERPPHLHGSPKLSSRLWTSHILLLRAGARHMIPSRKCARGSLLLWTRWAVTRPSGRRWIHWCDDILFFSRRLGSYLL